MKKRLLSVFLVLCLIFTLLPVGATADAATSGTCGSNLKWKLERKLCTECLRQHQSNEISCISLKRLRPFIPNIHGTAARYDLLPFSL